MKSFHSQLPNCFSCFYNDIIRHYYSAFIIQNTKIQSNKDGVIDFEIYTTVKAFSGMKS